MRTGITLALAVVLLVVAGAVGVRLYLADPTPDEPSSTGHASYWNRYRVVDDGIVVEKITNPCSDISDVAVEETDKRVVVTVFVEIEAAVCSQLAVTRKARVALDEPLGDRPVYDGECLDRGVTGGKCERRTVDR